MATRPMVRRNRAQRVKPLAVRQKQFHIYDENIGGKLGGVKIDKNEDGVRTVKLSPGQARYWLDQGVIGERPLADLRNGDSWKKEAEFTRQTLGQGASVRGEVEKSDETKPVPAETPRQRPRTIS